MKKTVCELFAGVGGFRCGLNHITHTTRYYYSETRPTDEGNFWHYDDDGKVVVW